MKDEPATVTIEKLAKGGDGVGRLPNGKVVFVPRSLPGDEVVVSIERDKKSYAHARIERFLTASEKRVKPECMFFERCGGCDFWHTSYEDSVSLKALAALETITKLGHFQVPQVKIHHAPSDRRYRSRATVHVAPNGVGFFETKTHVLVDVAECLAVEPSIEEAMDVFRMHFCDLSPFDVVLETSSEGKVVATVIAPAKFRWEEFRDRAGVFSQELFDGVVAPGQVVIFGEDAIEADHVVANAPPSLSVASGRFRQSYRTMNRQLVERVADLLGEGVALVEFFSGAGNLTFRVATSFQKVVALESDVHALEGGRTIARHLQMDHLTFRQADLFDAGEARASFAGLATSFKALLNPPRDGARVVCEVLGESRTNEILYISCDPATFARDAGILTQAGFSCQALEFFDMFPRTTHIETLARFTRAQNAG